MKKFIALFKKVGGANVLKQYLHAHVFLFAMVQTLLLGFSKKALEILRLAVNNKILGKLRKKYRSFIAEQKANAPALPRVRSNKIWVCWFQGIEQAPALVQRCYRSLQENMPDREVILLTEENYRDYVTFPAHIEEKLSSGVITKTHLSDLLRLELLIRHGGTWIDATVFCSGNDIPGYMLDTDLFVFQNLKPGADGHSTLISSWFMTACTNHPILLLTRALLYRYWEKNKKMVDYFLIHDFFQLAIEAYPEEWEAVIPFSNSTPHILLLRLFQPYDATIWDATVAQTPFHKLSYKFEPADFEKDGTFYKKLMS
ncbi:MAG: capsular polysaccharide synthesis protein [Oscillospiraceae bacterium]|nr:capsular polysaccharide synthesis protein [Oscillospiraceae bacterium]